MWIAIKTFFGAVDWAYWTGLVFGTVWRNVKTWPSNLIASIKAFLASPQVWFAAGVFAIAGYWGGYMVVDHKMRAVAAESRVLHAQVLRLSTSNSGLMISNGGLSTRLADALARIKEFEELKGAAPPPAATATPPVALERAVAKKRPTPPKPKPAPTFLGELF